MRETLQEKVAKASSLADILKILKTSTMLDTNVATLAYVKSIEKQIGEDIYGILNVDPFPLYNNQERYTIQSYYFSRSATFEIGDIVLIVFTNFNFISNLNNKTYTPLATQDLDNHLIKYGVAIPLQNIGEDTAEVPVVDNLTSTLVNAALSANQGRVLKGMVDNKADNFTVGEGLRMNSVNELSSLLTSTDVVIDIN